MSDEPQRIEMVQSPSKYDTAMGAITFLVWAGVMYYSMDPDGFQRNLDKIRSLWRRAQHRASVWQALGAIRSLPVTDITDITVDSRQDG